MKTLQHISESLLDMDDLESTTNNAVEINLANRLNNIKPPHPPVPKKDMAGRKIKVGDMVLAFGNHHLRIATIISMKGSNLVCTTLNDEERQFFPTSSDVLKINDINQISSFLKMLGL